MAPQESDTWQSHVVHLREWLAIGHEWEIKIPWLTLSHVGDDVIKRNTRKRGKIKGHTFGLRK